VADDVPATPLALDNDEAKSVSFQDPVDATKEKSKYTQN